MKKPAMFAHLVCLAVLTLAPLSPICTVVVAAESREEAVGKYLKAAADQLKAIRGQVDAEVKRGGEATKLHYQGVYAGLDRCDMLLEQLKNSPPTQFDPAKATFEFSRDDMIKTLEFARKIG